MAKAKTTKPRSTKRFYQVCIVEEIREERTYTVAASSPKAAAKVAAAMWLKRGQEPPNGQTFAVTERDYTVTGPQPSQTKTEYTSGEIESKGGAA